MLLLWLRQNAPGGRVWGSVASLPVVSLRSSTASRPHSGASTCARAFPFSDSSIYQGSTMSRRGVRSPDKSRAASSDASGQAVAAHALGAGDDDFGAAAAHWGERLRRVAL